MNRRFLLPMLTHILPALLCLVILSIPMQTAVANESLPPNVVIECEDGGIECQEATDANLNVIGFVFTRVLIAVLFVVGGGSFLTSTVSSSLKGVFGLNLSQIGSQAQKGTERVDKAVKGSQTWKKWDSVRESELRKRRDSRALFADKFADKYNDWADKVGSPFLSGALVSLNAKRAQNKMDTEANTRNVEREKNRLNSKLDAAQQAHKDTLIANARVDRQAIVDQIDQNQLDINNATDPNEINRFQNRGRDLYQQLRENQQKEIMIREAYGESVSDAEKQRIDYATFQASMRGQNLQAALAQKSADRLKAMAGNPAISRETFLIQANELQNEGALNAAEKDALLADFDAYRSRRQDQASLEEERKAIDEKIIRNEKGLKIDRQSNPFIKAGRWIGDKAFAPEIDDPEVYNFAKGLVGNIIGNSKPGLQQTIMSYLLDEKKAGAIRNPNVRDNVTRSLAKQLLRQMKSSPSINMFTNLLDKRGTGDFAKEIIEQLTEMGFYFPQEDLVEFIDGLMDMKMMDIRPEEFRGKSDANLTLRQYAQHHRSSDGAEYTYKLNKTADREDAKNTFTPLSPTKQENGHFKFAGRSKHYNAMINGNADLSLFTQETSIQHIIESYIHEAAPIEQVGELLDELEIAEFMRPEQRDELQAMMLEAHRKETDESRKMELIEHIVDRLDENDDFRKSFKSLRDMFQGTPDVVPYDLLGINSLDEVSRKQVLYAGSTPELTSFINRMKARIAAHSAGAGERKGSIAREARQAINHNRAQHNQPALPEFIYSTQDQILQTATTAGAGSPSTMSPPPPVPPTPSGAPTAPLMLDLGDGQAMLYGVYRDNGSIGIRENLTPEEAKRILIAKGLRHDFLSPDQVIDRAVSFTKGHEVGHALMARLKKIKALRMPEDKEHEYVDAYGAMFAGAGEEKHVKKIQELLDVVQVATSKSGTPEEQKIARALLVKRREESEGVVTEIGEKALGEKPKQSNYALNLARAAGVDASKIGTMTAEDITDWQSQLSQSLNSGLAPNIPFSQLEELSTAINNLPSGLKSQFESITKAIQELPEKINLAQISSSLNAMLPAVQRQISESSSGDINKLLQSEESGNQLTRTLEYLPYQLAELLNKGTINKEQAIPVAKAFNELGSLFNGQKNQAALLRQEHGETFVKTALATEDPNIQQQTLRAVISNPEVTAELKEKSIDAFLDYRGPNNLGLQLDPATLAVLNRYQATLQDDSELQKKLARLAAAPQGPVPSPDTTAPKS